MLEGSKRVSCLLFVFYKFSIFLPDIANPGFALVEDDFAAVFIVEFGGGGIAVIALPCGFDDLAVCED